MSQPTIITIDLASTTPADFGIPAHGLHDIKWHRPHWWYATELTEVRLINFELAGPTMRNLANRLHRRYGLDGDQVSPNVFITITD